MEPDVQNYPLENILLSVFDGAWGVETEPGALFQIVGADRVRYLHNRVTQDVKGLPVGSGCRALVLTPQGKIEADIIIVNRGESFTVFEEFSSAPEEDERLLSAIFRFRVADQVEAKQERSQFARFLVSEMLLRELFEGEVPSERYAFSTGSFGGAPSTAVLIPRGKLSTFLCFVPRESSESVGRQVREKSRVSGDDLHHALEFLRIATLTPRFGIDVTEKSVAPELPLSERVSFTKGCYAGQEVVEMATARGKTPRHLVSLRELRGRLAVPQTALFDASNSDSQELGVITSSAKLSSASIAIASVKSSVPAGARLRSADGLEFEVL